MLRLLCFLNGWIRGLNFMNAMWYAFVIFAAIRYWMLPMNSPELPALAHNPWGRWLCFFGLLFLCLFVGAVYSLTFWMGLAKLVVWIIWQSVSGAKALVMVLARGAWYVCCGAAYLTLRGVRAVHAAYRRKRMSRIPRGRVIDAECRWLDDNDDASGASRSA